VVEDYRAEHGSRNAISDPITFAQRDLRQDLTHNLTHGRLDTRERSCHSWTRIREKPEDDAGHGHGRTPFAELLICGL
jgi:hypothetical protein